MREAIRERRVEDDRQPTGRMRAAVDHHVARRRLHPRVERDDPEHRDGGAQRDQEGGEGVDALAHAAGAEQHDAEEARLQEERRQHLVGQQRPGDVADGVHVARPVGAELEAHRHARDHAQREGQREDLHPQAVRGHPRRVAGLAVAQLEEQQHPGQRDADGRKEDMEGDIGAELDARQHNGIEGHGCVLGGVTTSIYRQPPRQACSSFPAASAPWHPSSSAAAGRRHRASAHRRTTW